MNTLYVFLFIPAIIIVDSYSLTRGRFEYYVNEIIKSLRESGHTIHNVLYLTSPFFNKINDVI